LVNPEVRVVDTLAVMELKLVLVVLLVKVMALNQKNNLLVQTLAEAEAVLVAQD
tara:strand:- start:197 stop:358 length:162 start_codon:yes stop_codon:yes gene_type:complete